jgi:hypothetical protein
VGITACRRPKVGQLWCTGVGPRWLHALLGFIKAMVLEPCTRSGRHGCRGWNRSDQIHVGDEVLGISRGSFAESAGARMPDSA